MTRQQKKWDTERLQTLARIAIANGFVVFSTYYSDWSYREVALAYAGELVILLVVNYARVLSARRLPGTPRYVGGINWQLFRSKSFAILATLPIGLLFAGTTLIAVFGDIHGWNLPKSAMHSLVLAWLIFLISHVLEFIATRRVGAYEELINDGRIMAPFWRWPLMIFAFMGAGAEREGTAPFIPWFFVTILVLMAALNTRMQIAEIDALRASSRGRHRTPAAT